MADKSEERDVSPFSYKEKEEVYDSTMS